MAAKLVLLADTLLLLYGQMLRVRRCDQRLVKSFYEGLLPGDYFSAVGQEAVYVAVSHHLHATDLVFGNHHVAAQAVARGVPLPAIFAEAYGRVAGASGGRAGALMLMDCEQGMYGSGGAPGVSLLHAAGAAYALRHLHPERVAVCYFGDSAVASGSFHEALNLAGLFKLPLLLVYERNDYAGHAPLSAVVANPKIAVRAKNYEVLGVEVDGHDVSSVYAAAFEGLRRAREGRGATLLECHTTRLRSHHESAVQPPSLSGADVADGDPLKALSQRLLASEFATDAELATMDAEVRREIDAAHQQALASQHAAATRSPQSGSGDTRHG